MKKHKMTGVLILIISMIIIYIITLSLPDRIPTHFNFTGKATSYGSKYTLFIFVPIIFLIYLKFSDHGDK